MLSGVLRQQTLVPGRSDPSCLLRGSQRFGPCCISSWMAPVAPSCDASTDAGSGSLGNRPESLLHSPSRTVTVSPCPMHLLSRALVTQQVAQAHYTTRARCNAIAALESAVTNPNSSLVQNLMITGYVLSHPIGVLDFCPTDYTAVGHVFASGLVPQNVLKFV